MSGLSLDCLNKVVSMVSTSGLNGLNGLSCLACGLACSIVLCNRQQKCGFCFDMVSNVNESWSWSWSQLVSLSCLSLNLSWSHFEHSWSHFHLDTEMSQFSLFKNSVCLSLMEFHLGSLWLFLACSDSPLHTLAEKLHLAFLSAIWLTLPSTAKTFGSRLLAGTDCWSSPRRMVARQGRGK